jgi:predicted nucleic acid-binding Zn ribbon protein
VSDLEPVRGFLDHVLQRFGMPGSADLGTLVDRWPELAGEPWGSRSRPAGLRSGELVVEVDDGSVATLLKYRTGELLDALEEGLGARIATSVRIRVARPKKGL